DPAKARFEVGKAAGKVQGSKQRLSLRVDAHGVRLVEVDEAVVLGAVVRGGQGEAVAHVVHAAGYAHREDVSGINQTQLHSRYRAAIPVGVEHLLAKAAQSGHSADGLDNPPPLSRERG